MLGLGNSLITGGVVSGIAIAPDSITGLDLWLKFNTDIVGAAGGASNDGDMANGEDINSWADQSGNDRHAEQTTASKKPHWDTTTADLGGLRWTDDTADPSFNLATDGVEIGATQDFTIMIRVKLTDFTTAMALLGNSSSDLVKWTSNARVGALIGGSGISAFEETGGAVIATDTYYIHTFTRSNPSDGNLDYRVHGGDFDDKPWDEAEDHEDKDAFTITNIGVGNDNTLPVEGVFKDVIIWKGTALTAAQRAGVYAYIEAQ